MTNCYDWRVGLGPQVEPNTLHGGEVEQNLFLDSGEAKHADKRMASIVEGSEE